MHRITVHIALKQKKNKKQMYKTYFVLAGIRTVNPDVTNLKTIVEVIQE